MPKAIAVIQWDRCQPQACGDGNCNARPSCKKKVIKQDKPGEPPYILGPCVGCGECVEFCPMGAIKMA